MRHWYVLFFITFFINFTDAREIHREQSLYQTILVSESNFRRCLQFAVKRDQKNQTCFDTRYPKKMVFTYARMMMSVLLVQPNPRSILIIGLGGGTLPVALNELLPEARIDVVEIDPIVVEVAKRYFNFKTNAHIKVHVQDGRVFIKRAQFQNTQYDLVILDAFNGDYIPEHLMTKEFLEEVRDLLGPSGTIAANTFSISKLYDHESETYRAVFDTFFSLQYGETSNRILIAHSESLPSRQQLMTRAEAWENRLRPYGVPIKNFPKAMTTRRDWDQSARPLTDQYSPANLLRNQ